MLGEKQGPSGPKTVSESFRWASVYLARIKARFGATNLKRKLSSWRWDVSTVFSGVGCAEAVGGLVASLFRAA